MSKNSSKSTDTHPPVTKTIDDASLRELNIEQGAAELARERYAHSLTRHELVKQAADAAALRADIAARDARQQASARVRETRDELSAAEQRLSQLTADIRREHNLTEKHAIDALSGAILLPEG